MANFNNAINANVPGIQSLSTVGVWTGVTLTSDNNTVLPVTNGNGQGGNPTIEDRAWLTQFVVDPSTTPGTRGTYSTIQSAITAAVSGQDIFIRPGTYTENLTLKVGVNLIGFSGDGDNGQVTIIGKATLTAAGTVSISNIRLQTNSDFLLAVTGTLNSVVNLNNCFLNCSNNTGISFTTSGTSSQINVNNSKGNLGTTGIAIFSHSASGLLEFNYCMFSNTGSSTTANTASGIGGVRAYYTYFFNPLTTSGTTATFDVEKSTIDCNQINTTAITHGSTSGPSSTLLETRVLGGSASAISVSASATLTMAFCIIDSSNTNAITGGGTLNQGGTIFTSSSSLINTTTQTSLSVDRTALWTPNLQINGSSTGITYSTQVGGYVQIGNVITFWLNITLSSKGSSTGSVTISNFPITLGANGGSQVCAIGGFTGFTSSGTTTLSLGGMNSSAVLNIYLSGTGISLATVTNSMISNSFAINCTGCFFTQ